jgi:hypothetical protein
LGIKLRIDDLEEMNAISGKDREYILKEYKKGYHFLLFYGKFLVFILLAIASYYMVPAIKELHWAYKVTIYLAAGYLFSYGFKVTEINILAKKVLRDLIKDMMDK